jgi:hypothetical protein
VVARSPLWGENPAGSVPPSAEKAHSRRNARASFVKTPKEPGALHLDPIEEGVCDRGSYHNDRGYAQFPRRQHLGSSLIESTRTLT